MKEEEVDQKEVKGSKMIKEGREESTEGGTERQREEHTLTRGRRNGGNG